MGITVTTKRFATPTSTGEVTWTDINLGDLTPKAIMVIANHADTDGTPESHLRAGIGFTDGSTTRSSAIACVDGEGTTDTANTTNTAVFLIVDDDGSPDVNASFVSFGTNSVTLNFTTVDAEAQLWTVVFFAGSDLSVNVGAQNVDNTTEDEVTDVTSVGFTSDLIIGCLEADGVNNARWSFGAATSAAQKCWGFSSFAFQGTSKVGGILRASRIAQAFDVSADLQASIELTDIDASGFSLVTRDGALFSAGYFNWLALNFNGAASAWVGSLDSPTSLGDDAQTGPGFKPQFVMLGITDCQAEDTLEEDADAGSIAISCFTEDAEFSNAWADEDNVSTTNTQSLADDQAINFASGDGTTQHAATFVSMDADGHTLNYSVADGTARKGFGVAIEEVAAAPSGRIMSSLAGAGGLAGMGGIAGTGGGLAG